MGLCMQDYKPLRIAVMICATTNQRKTIEHNKTRIIHNAQRRKNNITFRHGTYVDMKKCKYTKSMS